MNIELVGGGLRPSEMLRKRLDQKLTKIETRLGEKLFVRVKLEREANDYVCGVRFQGGRQEYNAESTSDDLVKAVDDTMNKIERQVRKNHEKADAPHRPRDLG